MPNAGLDPYDCDCGWLDRSADDPNVPIGFDSKTGEYYIEMQNLGGYHGRAFIHYCPSCGGDAPVSKRPQLFKPVTAQDQLAAGEFGRQIRTKADVLARWGTPDEEAPGAYGMPEKLGDEGQWRTLLLDIWRYNNVLSSATLEVIVWPNDQVIVSYSPRPAKEHDG